MKKTINKKQKKIRRMLYEQVVNINKRIEIIKRDQIEIMELKSTIHEIKIFPEGFNRSFII